MAESATEDPRPTDPVGRVLYILSRIFAYFGGLMACVMAVLTTISVTGRYFFDLPIPGDFELVAIGTGVTAFAFLPYCQMVRENVIVDFFTVRAPDAMKSVLDAIGSLTYGVAITLVAWRQTLGTMDFYEFGETTMILEVPRWWTLPLAVACLALLVAVCAYTFFRDVLEVQGARRREQLPK